MWYWLLSSLLSWLNSGKTFYLACVPCSIGLHNMAHAHHHKTHQSTPLISDSSPMKLSLTQHQNPPVLLPRLKHVISAPLTNWFLIASIISLVQLPLCMSLARCWVKSNGGGNFTKTNHCLAAQQTIKDTESVCLPLFSSSSPMINCLSHPGEKWWWLGGLFFRISWAFSSKRKVWLLLLVETGPGPSGVSYQRNIRGTLFAQWQQVHPHNMDRLQMH